MSKRKIRMGRNRPTFVNFDPAFGIDRSFSIVDHTSVIVVDETSGLRARDFLIPPMSVGESVLVTNSDRAENNGVWIVRREGFARPAATEEQAPWLSIWSTNDRRSEPSL